VGAAEDGGFQFCAARVSFEPGEEAREPTHYPASLVVQVLHDVGKPAVLLERLVHAVQPQRSVCVLDRVVSLERTGARLDVLLEQEPAEEAQRELARMAGAVIQVDGVDDLRLGHVDV